MVTLSNYTFITWNVEGLSSKTNDNEFIDFISLHDFVCLTETFLINELGADIFKEHIVFQKPAIKLSRQGRPSGGLICLVRRKLAQYVKPIYTETGNFLFLLIDKSLLGLEKDVLYANAYIPPEGSPYYSSSGNDSDGIAILEDSIIDNVLLDNDVYVLLNGDLNSRTSNVAQPVSNDEDTFYDSVHSEDTVTRHSQDKTINTFGSSLLYTCSALDLCILNGTCNGDRHGGYTYISDNGCSVIDYFLMSRSLYANVFDECKLEVLERTECKHLPVRLTLKVENDNNVKETNRNEQQKPIKIEKFNWDENIAYLFEEALTNEHFLSSINDALMYIPMNIDDALEKFNGCLKEAASCMKKTVTINNVQSQKWFDQECRNKRQEVRKLLRTLRNSLLKREDMRREQKEVDNEHYSHKTANNEEKAIIEEQPNIDRQRYCVARREYNRLKERKKNEYNKSVINKLMMAVDSQKEFWETLKSIAPKRTATKNSIDQETWFNYFKGLLDKDDILSGTFDESDFAEDGSDLDYNRPISQEEVTLALKKLKPRKAAGPDMIISEMLKCANKEIAPFFVELFNHMFDNGLYPQKWTEAIILPLYKKGDKNDPGNYRGISISDISSKVYGSIINTRIQKLVDEHNLTGEIQAGFKSGYSTIDHAFTLMACVQKQFSNNCNRKLYVAFIDFQKCFDTINRNILWPILTKNGIYGKLSKCIRSMYESVKARVRASDNSLTEHINCTLGVKQGDICSPVLFSLYINELAIEITRNGRHGVSLETYELLALLLADDIILCSETVVGLQTQLNILYKAACRLHLTVNLSKSNIIVFRKGGYLAERERWFYNGAIMPVVNAYKYLGIIFSTKLSFTAACKDVSCKAKRALLYIIQRLRQYDNSSVHIFMKIFDAQIQPIMQYGSEIWGLYKASGECEKVHLYALKKFLNVDLKTPNDLVYTELHRYPIVINSYINAIRYWLKIVHMEQTRIPRKAYEILCKLDKKGKETWATKVRLLLFQNGFGYAWEHQGVGNNKLFLKTLRERLIDIRWQNVHEHITNSERFSFYSQITCSDSLLPCYISLDLKRHLKCIMTKFRFGVSGINTHHFRYRNVNQSALLCPFCKDVEETELHFVLCCPLYEGARKQYIKPKFWRIPRSIKLTILLSSRNEKTVEDLCRYLYVAFKIRDNFCS